MREKGAHLLHAPTGKFFSPEAGAQLAVKKRLAVSPVTISSCARDAETIGSLLMAHASEVSQLDEIGSPGRVLSQLAKSVVDGQDFSILRIDQIAGRFDRNAGPITTSSRPTLLPSPLDQNSSHSLGSG
jgi:hypothetical protein